MDKFSTAIHESIANDKDMTREQKDAFLRLLENRGIGRGMMVKPA